MKRIFIVLSLSLLTCHLFAWGQNGHRIVAQICYDNLPEKTKAEVNKILGNNTLAQIATWPDFIRSEEKWNFTQPWHFVTINPGHTASEFINKGDGNPKNVIEAIELMRKILSGDAAAVKILEDLMKINGVQPLDGSTKLTALSFLVHFIGDIHQPMHVGKGDDAGGNFVHVLFFDKKSNLHSVWDEGIIEQEQLSFTELAGFVEKHTRMKKADWQKASLVEWANESVDVREEIYRTYKLNVKIDSATNMPELKYQYQHDFIKTVEDRLGAAGYRAAATLISITGGSKTDSLPADKPKAGANSKAIEAY